MGFFDGAPREWLQRPAANPWDPATGQFGYPVGIPPLLLARTEKVALAVTGLAAFQSGFEFWINIRFHGVGRPTLAKENPPERALRFGLEFADGRKAATYSTLPEAAQQAEPTGIVLRAISFGVWCQSQYMHYWVWPLPPEGPVTFVCEWPAYGVGETAAHTDASLVRQAAGRSFHIWPDTE